MTESVAYIRVFVSDLARSVEFYTDRHELKPGMRSDEHRWTQFKTAGAVLSLEETPPKDLGEGVS